MKPNNAPPEIPEFARRAVQLGNTRRELFRTTEERVLQSLVDQRGAEWRRAPFKERVRITLRNRWNKIKRLFARSKP